MTTMSFGLAGWVMVEDPGLPGPLYLRLGLSDSGRWTVRELYLDGEDGQVTAHTLRRLPLTGYESMANENSDHLAHLVDAMCATSGMSVLASNYATTYGSQADPSTDWTVMAWVASADQRTRKEAGLGHIRTPKRRPRRKPHRPDSTYRLTQGPGKEGITDEFLADVARAYAAARARGDRAPNVTISRDVQASPRTVQWWVAEARKRGIMPPAKKGTAS